MRAHAFATLVLLATSGCIVDGALRVRGTVSRERDGRREPVEGAVATVAPTNRRVGAHAGPATTDAAGRFEVLYRFGGAMILFFGPGDGRPVLQISAPDGSACRIDVDAKELPPGVTRRPCAERGCVDLDVVLPARAPPAGAEWEDVR